MVGVCGASAYVVHVVVVVAAVAAYVAVGSDAASVCASEACGPYGASVVVVAVGVIDTCVTSVVAVPDGGAWVVEEVYGVVAVDGEAPCS